MVVISVVKSRHTAGGIPGSLRDVSQLMGFLTAGRGAEAVKMP